MKRVITKAQLHVKHQANRSICTILFSPHTNLIIPTTWMKKIEASERLGHLPKVRWLDVGRIQTGTPTVCL